MKKYRNLIVRQWTDVCSPDFIITFVSDGKFLLEKVKTSFESSANYLIFDFEYDCNWANPTINVENTSSKASSIPVIGYLFNVTKAFQR